MSKKELTLEGKVKNLQVSISIYRKEIKEILQSLPALGPDEKSKKLARLAVCDKWISIKEAELAPLKEELARTRPARQSKVQVSDEELASVMAKYNIK